MKLRASLFSLLIVVFCLGNVFAQGKGNSGGSPGNSGNAPGHGGGTPGNSGNAPGHGGGTPGNSGNAPGQSGTGEEPQDPAPVTDPVDSGGSEGDSGSSSGSSSVYTSSEIITGYYYDPNTGALIPRFGTLAPGEVE